MQKEGLNGDQLGLLEELVNIPSYYHKQRENGEKECDENEIMDFIEAHLKTEPSLTVVAPKMSDGRKNIIVEKGSGEEFTLWLSGHVDTVRLEGAKHHAMKFERKGDVMYGPGVGDMKQGIMGIMDVLKRVDVPGRMKVIGIFVCDEEIDSRGALEIIKLQEQGKIPKPDLIFSPEIPTVARPVSPGVVPITAARRGHVKLKGEIIVPKGHGGQGSDVPNSIRLFTQMLTALDDGFSAYQKTLSKDALLSHEDLVPRWVFNRRDHTLSVPDEIAFALSRLITTKTSIKSAYDLLRRDHDVFMRAKEAEYRTKIHATLQLSHPENTSYEAYEMPVPGLSDPNDMRIDIAKRLAAVVDRVYKGDGRRHQFTGGKSTSDANLYAQQGWLTYECTGDAAGEHSLKETASVKGAARTIQIMENLVSGRFLK